jgi:hypothetical protein
MASLSRKARELRRNKYKDEAEAVIALQQAIKDAIAFHLIHPEHQIPDDFKF